MALGRRRRFELTAEHVKLLRAANVSWDGGEYGAPTIDSKRPYGNGDVDRDIYALLVGGEWNADYGLPEGLTPAEWDDALERYRRLHKETQLALQVVLASGSFAPGVYEASEYGRDWRLADG